MPSDLIITRGGFNISSGTIGAMQGLGIDKKGIDEQGAALNRLFAHPEPLKLKTSGGTLVYALATDVGAAIVGYSGAESRVIVPDRCGGAVVKAVLGGAFAYNAAVREVCLPEGVEYVGQGAFRASGISRFRAPASLRYLAHDAFGSCQSIERIELPQRMQCIEFGCFRLAGGPPRLAFFSPRECIEVRYARNAAGLSAFRLLHFTNGAPIAEILAEADETLLTVYNPAQRVLGLIERLADPVLLSWRMRQAMERNVRSSFAPAVLSLAQHGRLDELDTLLNSKFAELRSLPILVAKLSGAGNVAASNLVLERMRKHRGAHALDFEV